MVSRWIVDSRSADAFRGRTNSTSSGRPGDISPSNEGRLGRPNCWDQSFGSETVMIIRSGLNLREGSDSWLPQYLVASELSPLAHISMLLSQIAG